MTEAVRHGGDEVSGAAMTTVAAALRWSRPDLTAGLAGHAADITPGDDPVWLSAAGWRVHGVAAVGDGRTVLEEVLDAASDGADPGLAEGLRLVVEVAAVSLDNGDTGVARRLAERALAGAGASAELRLDARLVLVRCAVAASEQGLDAERLLAQARGDAEAMPGIGPAAAVWLASAAVARAAGRPRQAVDAAEAGLRLCVEDGGVRAASAPYLADALVAQRIGGLLALGRTTDAREAARTTVAAPRSGASSRQAAQLRLVVAQATADDSEAAGRALAEAADHAAAVDVPGLEAACRTALAELAERTGALDVALREMRAGMAAEQRDKARGRRHRELVSRFEGALGGPHSSTEAERGSEQVASAEPPAVSSTPATSSGTSTMSAIDALLGSFDTAADAVGAEPLAAPVPARRVGVQSDADVRADASPRQEEPERPPRARRRARATAVPIEDAVGEGRAPAAAGAVPRSYGALLGDALISELRASGRWSDEGAGAWPRLARDRDRDTMSERGADPADEPSAKPAGHSALDGPSTGPAHEGDEPARSEESRSRQADSRQADSSQAGSSQAGSSQAVEPAPTGRAARRRAAEAAAHTPPPSPRPREQQTEALLSGAVTGRDETTDARAQDRAAAADLPAAADHPPTRDHPAMAHAASDDAAAVLGGRTGRDDSRPEAGGGAPATTGSLTDDWLRSALADLDRVWGRTTANGSSPAPSSAPADEQPARAAEAQPAAESDRAAVGASVVIDLVEGTERLRTRQAERVIRDLTDRMRVHLPRRGRVRDEDPATLQVDLPGRDRAECAAWMHPVIRDLATAVAGAMALDPIGMGGVTAFRLRGTVYGTDGQPGVQLVQEIPEPGGETARDRDVHSEDLSGRQPAGRRRHRRAAAAADEEDDSEPATTVAPVAAETTSGPDGAPEVAGGTGSRRSLPGSASSTRGSGADADATVDQGTGDGGNQAGAEVDRPGSTTPDEGVTGGTAEEAPEEKLGLGDLLAGAMAAYRGL